MCQGELQTKLSQILYEKTNSNLSKSVRGRHQGVDVDVRFMIVRQYYPLVLPGSPRSAYLRHKRVGAHIFIHIMALHCEVFTIF